MKVSWKSIDLDSTGLAECLKWAERNSATRVVQIEVSIDGRHREFSLDEFSSRLGFNEGRVTCGFCFADDHNRPLPDNFICDCECHSAVSSPEPTANEAGDVKARLRVGTMVSLCGSLTGHFPKSATKREGV